MSYVNNKLIVALYMTWMGTYPLKSFVTTQQSASAPKPAGCLLSAVITVNGSAPLLLASSVSEFGACVSSGHVTSQYSCVYSHFDFLTAIFQT